MPFRDGGEFLSGSIGSVLSQSFGDFELIVVDDGSGCEAAAEADRLVSGDTRARVIHLEPRGVSAARNAALDVAQGRYVAFVDSDDTLESDYLKDLFDRSEETGADYVVAPYTIEREDGAESAVPLKGEYMFKTNAAIRDGYLPRIFGYSMDDVREWYGGRPLFSGRETAGVWRGLFRRGVIESSHIRFDESITLYEDAMFLAAFLLKAEKMSSTLRPLYRYRLRSSGSMLGEAGRRRLVKNKLALLKARCALDKAEGGSLFRLFAASCVFSLLESAKRLALHPSKDDLAAFKEYMRHPATRAALADFPLSPKHPLLALAVSAARLVSRRAFWRDPRPRYDASRRLK